MPLIPEPAGVADLLRMQQATANAQACAAGNHAWVPWLQLENGSWVTWCARESCDHVEQHDG